MASELEAKTGDNRGTRATIPSSGGSSNDRRPGPNELRRQVRELTEQFNEHLAS